LQNNKLSQLHAVCHGHDVAWQKPITLFTTLYTIRISVKGYCAVRITIVPMFRRFQALVCMRCV